MPEEYNVTASEVKDWVDETLADYFNGQYVSSLDDVEYEVTHSDHTADDYNPEVFVVKDPDEGARRFKVTAVVTEMNGEEGGEADATLSEVQKHIHRYFVARHGKDYVYKAPETFNNALEQWMLLVAAGNMEGAEERIVAIEEHWRNQ